MKKYIVTLAADERQTLLDLIAAGKAAAKKLAHARILLKADAAEGGPAWPDHRIAEALEVGDAPDRTGRRRGSRAPSSRTRPGTGRRSSAARGCARRRRRSDPRR